jgi:hypothetical protein
MQALTPVDDLWSFMFMIVDMWVAFPLPWAYIERTALPDEPRVRFFVT